MQHETEPEGPSCKRTEDSYTLIRRNNDHIETVPLKMKLPHIDNEFEYCIEHKLMCPHLLIYQSKQHNDESYDLRQLCCIHE